MNTNDFLNLVAGNVFGVKTNPSIPAKYYIGLSTSAPTVAGGNVSEPVNKGYARVELSSLGVKSGVDGGVTNSADINFAESTRDWGTITHFVIYDALTGGTLLMYGALNVPRTVESATIMTIKAGALNLNVQNPTA